MNFIKLDETTNFINMDNVTIITESKDGVEVNFIDGSKACIKDSTPNKSLNQDLWNAIERMDKKNHSIRIDDLKTINVKVVNK